MLGSKLAIQQFVHLRELATPRLQAIPDVRVTTVSGHVEIIQKSQLCRHAGLRANSS